MAGVQIGAVIYPAYCADRQACCPWWNPLTRSSSVEHVEGCAHSSLNPPGLPRHSLTCSDITRLPPALLVSADELSSLFQVPTAGKAAQEVAR